jgi:serine protease AprX
MGRRLTGAVLAVVIAGGFIATRPIAAQTGSDAAGLNRILSVYTGSAVIRAVATFPAVAGAVDVANLRQLGLAVQPMKHVPLAIVVGPVSAMQAAVTAAYAEDVFPDERIELFDTRSSDALGAASLRAAGLTGKGVTVAVVDSGCDATHPDLSDHVVHNVKLYSGEYVNIRPDGSNTIVVPFEMGPYQNSDIGGGHGTHVAGIIAADSTTAIDGSRFGVAPDADLVCYSIGEILFTSAVVTAYDHLLDQPNLWGVRVMNNSWGNSFRPFDPRDPVAVVTKAVADLGVAVVFAAGNSGYETAEMSLNPFSQAPWVISVAADTVARVRANFSSTGLMFDNSLPVQIGAGGHNTFLNNRIGVYHPDVTAPGQSISSTCSTAGVAVRACPPYGNTSASGTSMASPHVAGAVAVLLQANPNLTPQQVRQALQATAVPVATSADDDNPAPAAPFWQVGYGHVNLAAAVDLARGRNWAHKLSQAQSQADARVLSSLGYTVPRSDVWSYDAPRVAAAGSDHRTYSAPVASTVTHLKVTLSHPSGAVLGENGMIYTVTVRDASGQVLGTTTEAATGAGTASLFVDFGSLALPAAFGEFTFEVNGVLAVSDPDTIDSESLLGRMVTLQVAQLRKQ